MLIKFVFRKINISFLKLRIVVKKICKFSILNMLVYLNFLNKKSSFILKKILFSCIFSLKNRFLNFLDFKIVKFSSEKDKCLKRILFNSKGRFSILNKKRSNVIIFFSSLKY